MGNAVKYRIVTYRIGATAENSGTRIYLNLEGPIVRNPGLAPDVWPATLPAREYEKFGSDFDRDGILELWSTNPPGGDNVPDVRLDRVRVVDAEAIEFGREKAGGPLKATVLRVHLADRRERFTWPRGGSVNAQINIDPFDETTGKDANGNPLRNNREIVNILTTAMGLGEIAPDSLKDKPQLHNLEWRGEHAPTELAKILDELHYVFTVNMGGDCHIWSIGDTTGYEVPQIEDEAEPGGIVLPNLDRRGKIVIFSSQPTAIANTVTVKGIGTGLLQWVCPDVDGTWKPAGEHSLLSGKDLRSLVRNNFSAIPEAQRQIIRKFLYRAFRLDPAAWPTAVFYRARLGSKGLEAEVKVEAPIAVMGEDSVWRNSTAMVRCTPASLVDRGRVLVVQEFLGKVETGKAADIPDSIFEPLTGDELQVTFTTDVIETAADGSSKPRFFTCGFQMGMGGAIIKLTPAEVETAINGPDSDRLVISLPEMRLYQIEGVDQNRGDLEKIARLVAPRFLRASGERPRIHIVRGFSKRPPNLGGIVSRLEYDQEKVQTRVYERTWFLPHATYLLRDKNGAAKGSPAGGSRTEPGAREQARRSGLGQPGATVQPSVPLMPAPAIDYGAVGRAFVVDLTKDGGSDGNMTEAASYTYTVKTLGGVRLLTGASPVFLRPAGSVSVATKGLAYFDLERSAKLLYAHEIPATDHCPEAA